MQVAFDIGNVLVHVDFEEFFRELKLNLPSTDPEGFICDIQVSQDLGIKTMHTALKERFDLKENQINSLMISWNNAIQPNDEMLNFINDLKGSGIEVAILSNIGFDHSAHIRERYPHIFDGCKLHLSSEVGARKPTKLYYQSFLMQYPSFRGCMFWDDRPENLKAAKEFGLDGYHFELNKFVQKSSKEQKTFLENIFTVRLGVESRHI